MMMKIERLIQRLALLSSVAVILTIRGAERDGSLLFSVNFDDYSVNADFAKGDPNCRSFENPDLQLRMFPGINGKGNALSLTNEENCIYGLSGNLDPRQGTVSVWVSPQNWKVSGEKWQQFFSVHTPQFTMILYKYIWPKYTLFYLKFPGAPGKKKVFAASTMLEDADWTKGSWHKLDITWNSKGMKLYIDGVMPEVYHKDSKLRIPFVEFQNPLQFPKPEDLKKSVITFGLPTSGRKNIGTDLSYTTAYDDINIYDRPLSAAEIKTAYEIHFPSKLLSEVQPPVITIPKTGRGIEVDGTITPAEWADAGLVPVSGFLGTPLPGVSAQAHYKYDDTFLYIGMRANRACRMLKNHRDHDGNLWEEDSFEIVLQSPEKHIYHLIINGNGAVYDELDTDKKWNSAARSAAVQGKDYWSAEIAIPLKSFQEEPAGQEWHGNLCATYYTNTGRYSGWSKIRYSYTAPNSFGVIRFGTDDTAVRLNNIGNLSLGTLALSVDVVPPAAASKTYISAQCEPDKGPTIEFPGQLAGKTWNTILPIGKQKLQIKGMQNKKSVNFLYETFTYVNFPLEVSYTCWSKRKYVEVNIDLNNSGSANLKALSATGLPGVVQLVDDRGSIQVAVPFTARKPNCDVKLGLPAGLASGKYSIVVEISGVKEKLSREAEFSVPDMTPYKERVAVDHSIPAPWQAITTTDGRTFRLLDREYTFGDGAFPIRVVSRSQDVLSSPVVMRCNDSLVKWSGFKIAERHSDVIKFRGRGSVGDVAFQWTSELWFDGLYYLDLEMSPGKEPAVNLESLKISWDMPPEAAKFVLSPLYNKWENNQIRLMPNPPSITAREHLVWLTGHLRGFLWWPESRANWFNPENEKPIVISRANEQVSISLNIISKPVKLEKTARYKMAFMATPAKDQPKNFRAFHADGYGKPKGQTAQHIGWGSHKNEFYPSDTTGYVGQIPRDPVAYKKVVQSYRKKGIAPFTYGMPGQISSKTPEYDYFRKTWATIPSHSHRFAKGGTKYQLQRCCGNTGVSDLFVMRTEKLFQDYPDLGGLYYDVGSSAFCQNTEHGHGGVDAFGQPYFSSGAMALRQLLVRLYKLHKKYDKVFFYHSHSYFNPVCHTFIDYFYPGEQYYRMIAKNYKYAYCEGISLEEYQSELNGRIKGVGLQFLPQYGRAAGGIQSIKHLKKEFLTNPEWAIRTMTPLLLHDVNVTAAYIDRVVTVPKLWGIQDENHFATANFLGYWTNPGVKSTAKKVLISVYSWEKPAPYRKILAVGNMGREEQPASVVIDPKLLGIPDKVEYFELWNNKPVTAEELQTMKIKGNHFLLIGIK